jgi:hypothetical protein
MHSGCQIDYVAMIKTLNICNILHEVLDLFEAIGKFCLYFCAYVHASRNGTKWTIAMIDMQDSIASEMFRIFYIVLQF